MILLAFVVVVLMVAKVESKDEEGWIYNSTVFLSPHLTAIESAVGNKLILSDQKQLYLTQFDSPDLTERLILDNFNPETGFTYNNIDNQVIYIYQNEIRFITLDPTSKFDVPRLSPTSPMVKDNNIIYFFDVEQDQYLYRYNLGTKVLERGEKLGEALTSNNLLTQTKSGKLFAISDRFLSVIDKNSFSILQRIILEEQNMVDIEFSEGEKYMLVLSPSMLQFYGLNSATQEYELKNIVGHHLQGVHFGGYCSDDGLCKVADFTNVVPGSSLLFSSFNVEDFSFRAQDHIEDRGKTVIADDGVTIIDYHVEDNWYCLYRTTQDGLEKIKEADLDFVGFRGIDVQHSILEGDKYLLTIIDNGDLYIWDLVASELRCKISLSEPTKHLDNFELSNEQLFFVDQNRLHIMDLRNDCRVEIFPEELQTIQTLTATQDKIYLACVNPTSFVVMNRESRQVAKRFTLPTFQMIYQRNDRVIGYNVVGNRFYLSLLNSDMETVKKLEVYCNSWDVDVSLSEEYLAYSCFKQFQIIKLSTFEYVGSFYSTAIENSLKSTNSPQLWFSQREGVLYRSKMSLWQFQSFNNSVIPVTTLENFIKFIDKDTIYFYDRSNDIIYLNHINLSSVSVRQKIKVDKSARMLKSSWGINKKCIINSYLSLNNFHTYISIYDTLELQAYITIDVNMYNGQIAPMTGFGYDIDDQGSIIIALSDSAVMFNIFSNTTEDPRAMGYITSSVAVSQFYRYFAFAGVNSKRQQIIEVWTTKPNAFFTQYMVSSFLNIDRIFVLDEKAEIFVISDSTLYEITKNQLRSLRQDISDCQALDSKELICKLLSGEIAVVSSQSSVIINTESSPANFLYAIMELSMDKQIIVEYGNDETFVVSHLINKTQQERVTIRSTQDHISKVAISDDKKSLVTYNCVENSAIIWKYRKCSEGRQPMEGICQCKGNLLDFGANCGCNDGQFANGQSQCQQCSFMCVTCSESSGNCTEVNAISVLMIVSGFLFLVIVILIIWRCIKKKKEKHVQLTSELLESTVSKDEL